MYAVLKAEHDREDDWEHNQDVIDRSASRITGKAPPPAPHETESDFLAEQARRKEEIDRQREIQLQRLREFNSPLPNPVHPTPTTSLDGIRYRSPSAPPPQVKRPAIGVRPMVDPPKRQQQETSGSTSTGSNDDSDENTTVAATADSGGLFGGGTRSQMNGAFSPAVAEIEDEEEEEPPQPPPPSRKPQPQAWSNWFNNYDDPMNKEKVKPSSSAPTPAPAPPARERKGPIRMQLPLGDEDEEGVDVRSNKKMSIAEAMKKTTNSGSIDQGERSKKWGIDISRFMDE